MQLSSGVIEVVPTYELKALNKHAELGEAIEFCTDAYQAYVDSCAPEEKV